MMSTPKPLHDTSADRSTKIPSYKECYVQDLYITLGASSKNVDIDWSLLGITTAVPFTRALRSN